MDRINIVQSGLTLSLKPSDLRIEFGNDSISVRAADNVVLFAGYDLPPETPGDYAGWAEWDGCSFATNDDRKLFEQTIQLAVEKDF